MLPFMHSRPVRGSSEVAGELAHHLLLERGVTTTHMRTTHAQHQVAAMRHAKDRLSLSSKSNLSPIINGVIYYL